MNTSTISANNQTTIPREVRQRLGLQAGDKILYEIDGESIILRAQPSALSAFGSLQLPRTPKAPKGKRAKNFQDERKGARSEWVKKATE